MSQHEVLALNANFQNWKNTRAAGLGETEPFLYYSVEHITKQYGLTDEEVSYGITDHPNDGGIDAIYCMAGKKNILIRDDVATRIDGAETIRILLFQSKSSLSETGYKPADVDNFTLFVDDLLNLEMPASRLAHKYETHLLAIMQAFKDKYLQMAGSFPTLTIEVYYITRGDELTVTPQVQDAIDRLSAMVEKHRGKKDKGNVEVIPVDTQKLLDHVRKRRQRTRLLKWASTPLPIGPSYVGLVKIADYYNFLKDEKTELDELIFESNVRGNQGMTSVNRQIRLALDKWKNLDFWQLNNGVTVTSPQLNPIDAWKIEVHDAQIVNGLQTSRQVFAHFKEGGDSVKEDDRLILVKLISVSDDTLRNKIIRATNNQNPMKASALLATSELHFDIEDLFKQYGIFYDRRPGFYKDQEQAIKSIVSTNEVIQAVVSIILHRPDDARARPGDYLKEDKKGIELYKKVFGSSRRSAPIPLGAYLKCVLIIRDVTRFLEGKNNLSRGDRHNLKFYVAFCLCCDLTQNASPTANEVLSIESSQVTPARLESALQVASDLFWGLVKANVPDNVESPDGIAKGTELLALLNKHFLDLYGARQPVAKTRSKTKKIKDVLKDGEIK